RVKSLTSLRTVPPIYGESPSPSPRPSPSGRGWVKPPFQQDQVFLADVQRVLDANGRALWWLGQSGFLVVQHGQALVFDPYLSDSLTRKYAHTDKPHTRITERVVDPAALGRLGIIHVITSSHNHTDHLDAETLVPLLAF